MADDDLALLLLRVGLIIENRSERSAKTVAASSKVTLYFF
jgi:hypothetical protein